MIVKLYFEVVFCEYFGGFVFEVICNFFWIMVYYDFCLLYLYFYYWFELVCMDIEFNVRLICRVLMLYNIFDLCNEGMVIVVEEMFM